VAACIFHSLPLPFFGEIEAAPGIEDTDVVAGVFGGLIPFLGGMGTSLGTGVFCSLPLPLLGRLDTSLGAGVDVVVGAFHGLPLPLLGCKMGEPSGRVKADGCQFCLNLI